MISREFVLEKRFFLRRKLTVLQHKLRVVMNCYTVVNFKLNDIESTFSFQKSYKISGVRINDSNTNTGRYIVEDIPTTDKIILTIIVD